MTQAQQPAPDPIPAPTDQRLYVVDRVDRLLGSPIPP